MYVAGWSKSANYPTRAATQAFGGNYDAVVSRFNVATTGDSGTYSFTALPPGLYRLSAELTGFRDSLYGGVASEMRSPAGRRACD